MNTPNNKRGQETRQKIDEAFVTLLQENSLNEIEISELCELAQINRSTFYAHYNDVNALANAYSAKIENHVEAQSHTDGEFTWIFEYIKANANMFEIYFKLGMSKKSADYKRLFFRNGVYAVAKLWFECGCKEPAGQMGEIVKREHTKIRQSAGQI